MTGMSYGNILSEMGFGAYSPATQFLMTPLFEDLLRVQAIDLNDMIRKSQYSFSISNNVVRFTPIFTKEATIWFDYMVVDDKSSGSALLQSGSENSLVSDFSNIPYNNIQYKDKYLV